MSHRTKLIITAVFLVLLAIPVVYAVLTWSPANPLRFHLKEIPLRAQDDRFEEAPVLVLVENTSAIPVRLILAHVMPPEDAVESVMPIGSINADVQSMMSADTEGMLVREMLIPAHGTLEVWAMVRRKALPQVTSGRSFIGYLWMSRTKAAADAATVWMRIRAPKRLQAYVPWIDHDEDDTPFTASGAGE